MRLLSVISTLNPSGGGTTQAVRLLHDALTENGQVSEVVCCDDPASPWLSDWQGTVSGVGQGTLRWAHHPNLVPWLRARAPLFDAVLVHGLWLYPSYAVSKVLGRNSHMPPYWVFPHGMLDPWFQRAPERRLKAIRNWLYWKAIENEVINNSAGLLFTCEEEKRLARTTFHAYRPKREECIGFGILEPPPFRAAMTAAFEERCPALAGRPYFLFLSRIHPKKGIDLLIQSYARLCNENSATPPPVLVLAGPGFDSDYGQKMQKLAEVLNMSGRILWSGMLSGDSKWGAFYGCEAFILPSHQENFGIVVAESLACGKPVLISNQVNIWREIEAEGAGFVDQDDVHGTLQMLRRWTRLDKSGRCKMAASAHSCYHKHFRVAAASQRLIEALTETADA